ncbi:MAG: hypothetical protein ACRBN8_12280 [Nannocystales bacterium]
MFRLSSLLLLPLLVLPACESEPSDSEEVETEVEAVVEATADVAVFLCECSLSDADEGVDACNEAAEGVFDDTVNECVEDVVAMDPESREVMRCSTAALRGLLDCYESAGLCPDGSGSSSSGPGADPDMGEEEPISDDTCGHAFEADIEACGQLPATTQDALDTCLVGEQSGSGSCRGETC